MLLCGALLVVAVAGYERSKPKLSSSLAGWTDNEVAAFTKVLDQAGTYVHVVEFGGGASTAHFSRHDNVKSWTAVAHDRAVADSLKQTFSASDKVAITFASSDDPTMFWEDTAYDSAVQEGTLAEYESYVDQLAFFGTEKRENPFWILNSGKARVDVGIAALPVLVRTGGVMVVSDWERPCYSESLLQFYDLQSLADGLAVLKPKPTTDWPLSLQSESAGQSVSYDWCFSWGNAAAAATTIRQKGGPADMGAAMAAFTENAGVAGGCADIMGGRFGAPAAPVPCFAALQAITRRGQRVDRGVAQALEATAAGREL